MQRDPERYMEMQRDADTSMMADRNDSERLGDFCFWTDGWMNKQTDISYMQTVDISKIYL